MSEEIQHKGQRKRTGWWIAAIVVSLLLLYLLSPPLLVEMVGVETYVDYFRWMHTPLVEVSHSSQLVRNWYGRYFELFPDDYWYAWYLDPDPYDGGGGFGEVRDIRPLY